MTPAGAAPPGAPYPGLASYGDGDADLFFGREAERDLIVANLRAARLTILYGPGGVGKSSLLHAGVVHRLRAMARPRRTGDDEDSRPRTDVVILDDWSGDPTARLAAMIRALADGTPEPPRDGEEAGASEAGLSEAGASDAGTSEAGTSELRDAVRAFRASHGGALLVVLDQFEEHIRLHPDPRANGFDDALAELVSDPRSPARVLIAIREDRLAGIDRFAGRIPHLLSNTLRLGPLSAQDALAAIEKPVERFAAVTGRDVALEPGLAETVRDELVALDERKRAVDPAANGGPAGGSVDPSYLQLVMRRLWDVEIQAGGGTRIRTATLASLGGVDEIVATHLDDALDRLSGDEQALVAEMLRFLVTPSGATACLTARDLADYTGRRESDVEALAERLSSPPARILRGIAASTGGAQRGGYELPAVLADPASEWRARRRVQGLEHRARLLLLGLVTMTAITVALVGYALEPGPLKRLELASVDARFDLRGAKPQDSRIAVVGIDATPANPRTAMARALAKIATADPRAVAVNISYLGRAPRLRPRAARAADMALIRAVDGPLKDRLVLSTDQVNIEGEAALFGRSRYFGDESRPAVGWDGLPLDPGGAVRRITPAVKLDPTGELDRMGVVAARLARGHVQKLPGSAWIAYRGAGGTYARIPFDDVVAGRSGALAKLRGKVVLIGYTDRRSETSAPGANEMNRTEIQANAISTALDGFPLRSAGGLLDVTLIVLLGLLPFALALRLRAPLVVALCLLAAGAFCVAAQLAFAQGRVIAVVWPLSSLLLATVAVTVVLVLRGRGSRRAPVRSAPAGTVPATPA